MLGCNILNTIFFSCAILVVSVKKCWQVSGFPEELGYYYTVAASCFIVHVKSGKYSQFQFHVVFMALKLKCIS